MVAQGGALRMLALHQHFTGSARNVSVELSLAVRLRATVDRPDAINHEPQMGDCLMRMIHGAEAPFQVRL